MIIHKMQTGVRTGMRFFSDATSDREVARLRAAVGDIIWRSRATLLTLAFFAALNLGLDQSSDVLIGLAHAFVRGDDAVGMLWAAVGFGVTALAVWMYAYSCWLWPRLLARMGRPGKPGDEPPAPPPEGAQTFAKHWARALGCVPLLVILLLTINAARAAFTAGDTASADWLVAFGVIVVVGGVGFWWRRVYPNAAERDARGWRYYDLQDDSPGARGELGQEHYRFLFLKRAGRDLLPLALLLFIATRAVSLFVPELPAPVTLAVINTVVTFWTCALSLFTRASLKNGHPWFLYILFGSLLLTGAGFNENHRVWRVASDATQEYGGAVLQIFLCGLAMTALLAASIWRWHSLRAATLTRRVALSMPLFVLALVALPWLADRQLPRHLDASPRTAFEDARPPLSEALQKAFAGSSGARAYLVSAEGGGVRSAYWTARTLAELTVQEPEFPQRVFVMSGVSGGSLGIAVWRTCLLNARQGGGPVGDRLIACVEQFGATDLLTPLLSTWLFEDALARLIPTSWCNTPGCGFMTRAAWFERRLEQAVPGMAVSLAAQRNGVASMQSPHWVPYVLLNASTLETGERFIASDLQTPADVFLSSRDQLAALGAAMPVSAAAHNSARFPYTNPIGILQRAAASDCPAMYPATHSRVCGHLADGGYFDNSGAHSLEDVLRGMRECVATAQCPPLDIRYISLHNGIDTKLPWLFNPANAVGLSTNRVGNDLLGPPGTLIKAAGTGAGARRAEASLNADMPKVVRLDLLQDQLPGSPGGNVLYPLGWYLSPLARDSMREQAIVRVKEYLPALR